MYSDIVPPKKNSLATKIINDKPEPEVIDDSMNPTPIKGNRGYYYHTVGGKDRKSRWPIILFAVAVVALGIVYYSVFNNKTTISFEPKTVIVEVKDTISMSLSEKNQNSSTTLSYNLIYNNDNKNRDIFAPLQTDTSTSTAVAKVAAAASTPADTVTITSTTTNSTKTVKFINETSANISVVKNTRVDVGGVTYYLDKAVDIKKTPADQIASTTNKYRVIGFKGTDKYEKFYAVDAPSSPITEVASDASTTGNSATTNPNAPGDELLSLIPENFIPLRKGYIFDQTINQSALVVIDKKDFQKALMANSKTIQDYVQSFEQISNMVEYDININDYELVLDPATGLPTAIRNMTLEIKPRILKDKVAEAFKGFSKDTMKQLKNDLAKNLTITVTYSPFWMSKVSDEDHISVEVK